MIAFFVLLALTADPLSPDLLAQGAPFSFIFNDPTCDADAETNTNTTCSDWIWRTDEKTFSIPAGGTFTMTVDLTGLTSMTTSDSRTPSLYSDREVRLNVRDDLGVDNVGAYVQVGGYFSGSGSLFTHSREWSNCGFSEAIHTFTISNTNNNDTDAPISVRVYLKVDGNSAGCALADEALKLLYIVLIAVGVCF